MRAQGHVVISINFKLLEEFVKSGELSLRSQGGADAPVHLPAWPAPLARLTFLWLHKSELSAQSSERASFLKSTVLGRAP